ncbi:MAG: succinate dehydrogenase cytochrome b subunit [Candidatus Methanofastidiosa archaeon]|nr:succinate dehydrogenase cytochrome b subunit [Candidatus Methanofastidiosa archaeon]
MNWLFKMFNQSIGKKLLMALTGLFLIVFLCVHLFGNIFLYVGKDAFNLYVHTLNETALVYFIRLLEIGLVLGFGFHIWDGLRLWLQNRKARPIPYKINSADPNSTFASRNMIISASIVFIFLVIHLKNFWYAFKYEKDPALVTDYDIVLGIFKDPVYSLIYVFAMILLGLHLWHGFQSAFQTLGLNHQKYTPFIKAVGRLFAFLIAFGFASFPIYFFFFGR